MSASSMFTVMAAEFIAEHRWHVPAGPSERRMEPGTYTWSCPCLPVAMTFVSPGDDEDEDRMRRASGDVRCDACGLPYSDHPRSYHRSFAGEPYLHRLCDGGLVHL